MDVVPPNAAPRLHITVMYFAYFFVQSDVHNLRWPEPFLSYLQKVIFLSDCKYFFNLNVIFCPLKNYHTIQKVTSVIIDVYKFGQEIFTIGSFLIFLYKYLEMIPDKAA